MFGCNKIRNLPYVRSYEEALSTWEKAPEPTARQTQWGPAERPLVREYDRPFNFWHYRLLKWHDYIDVILYRTAMARYYKPAGGKRVVLYHGHDSTASRQFRWHVLNIGEFLNRMTDAGHAAYIPIGGGGYRVYDDGDYFTTKLTTNADGIVLIAESDHPQVYRTKVSAIEREYRKEIRERVKDAVLLAVMRMSEYRDSCDPDRRKTRPGKGVDMGWQTQDMLKLLARRGPQAMEQVHWERFFAFCQEVFDVLVSKRLRYENGGSYGTMYAYEALEEPVTEAQFMRSLTNYIVTHGGEYIRRDEVDIPKFSPAELVPKSSKTR